MFNQLGWQEIGVILVLILVVVGPDRLPGVAADAGRQLRQLRLWLKSMSADLKSELGPEFQDIDIASLHPKTFVKKHLLEDFDLGTEEDEAGPSLVKAGSGPGPTGAVSRGAVPLGKGETPPWDPDTT